jgi:hypothetical protein
MTPNSTWSAAMTRGATRFRHDPANRQPGKSMSAGAAGADVAKCSHHEREKALFVVQGSLRRG